MHFLERQVREHRYLLENTHRPCASVIVKLEVARPPRLMVEPGSLMVVKHSVQFFTLPPDIVVCSEDNKVIKGTFAISVETFDPCHVLVDLSVPVMAEILPQLFRHANDASSRRSFRR